MEKLKFAYDWCVGLIEGNPQLAFWLIAVLALAGLVF